MSRVVTYQTSRGNKINVCRRCERQLTERREWPRDVTGEEYATVSKGGHNGSCDVHQPDTENDY